MDKTTRRSILSFLPENPFFCLFVMILLVALNFAAGWNTILMRGLWCFFFLIHAENVFPRAWKENKSTLVPLMDALLVPYRKKHHFLIQSVLLCITQFVMTILLNFAYSVTLSLSHAQTLELYSSTMLSSVFILFFVIFAGITKDAVFRTVSYIAAVILIFDYSMPFYSFLTNYALAGFILLVIGLILAGFYFRKEASTQNEEITPVIDKNLKGILTLSKMKIIKEKPVLRTIGTGLYGYWLWRFAFNLIRLLSLGDYVSFSSMFNWFEICIVLAIISLLLSHNAINRIYVSKNMLRVVPVKKSDLFSACTLMAAIPIVLMHLFIAVLAAVMTSMAGTEAFFSSTHPVEIIVHGLMVAVIPYAVYLLSFSVHAFYDRGLSMFVIGFLALLSLYVGGWITAFLGDSLMIKIILLAAFLIIPYITAWIGYKKMENIHI